MTLGEDRSPLRLGAGPTVMAMLRAAAINLLRLAGGRAIAARLRFHSRHPHAALALVGLILPQRA